VAGVGGCNVAALSGRHSASLTPRKLLQGLDEAVDRSEVLQQLVADGQDSLAQQWATSLGRDYQVGRALRLMHGTTSLSRVTRLNAPLPAHIK
jgi:hypothetical protein